MSIRKNIRKSLLLLIVALLLCAIGILYFCVWRNQNDASVLLDKIEAEAREERWEQVLELCSTYLESQPLQKEKDSLYFEFVDYTKFALCLTHQLPEKFFAYTKYFDRGVLFPDGSSTTRYMYFAPKLAYFYYSTGLQNMAMHQSFGCIVQDESPEWAVETYLKAIQIRNQESYGEVFRAKFKSLSYVLDDSVIQAKRKLLPDITEETTWTLDRNMYVLFEGNKKNKFAYEYVMTMALSYKDHTFFMDNIEHIANFDYDSLPKHFEEGILAYLFSRPENAIASEEEMKEYTYGGFKLHPENIARVQTFLQWVQEYQTSGMGMSKIKKHFEDTYWFHYVFGDITPKNPNNPQNNPQDFRNYG